MLSVLYNLIHLTFSQHPCINLGKLGYTKARFLSLSTTDIVARSFLAVGAVLCTQGCLVASAHYMSTAPSPALTTNQRRQTLPNVSGEGVQKCLLLEDLCAKVSNSHQILKA